MELSPKLYHWLVRPNWFSKKYISNYLNSNYCFKDRNVLDFGCGVGTNCTIFEPNNYLGVDCDLDRIDYACSWYPEYSFKTIDDCIIPVSNGMMDNIVIISVLHHIPCHEIPRYIEEFKRVLKPNGKVILIEPCVPDDDKNIRSKLMCTVDREKYIRNQAGYMEFFEQQHFETKIIKTYNQLFLYRKTIIEASLI